MDRVRTTNSPHCKPQVQQKTQYLRYYEKFGIDLATHESNLTRILRNELIRFLTKKAESENPFFLYWAPDSTHGPTYASKKFLGISRRGSTASNYSFRATLAEI